MGPEVMLALTAATTAASAGISAMTSMAQADAASKTARAQQQWAERQALEEEAAGQRAAAEETRKAKLAQSRLMAVAGASGSGASDPTVMDLWGDIEQEGMTNAGVTQAMARQRADSINYQAALDRWTADANKRIAKVGAIGTILGGLGSAGGDFTKSRMAARYGGYTGGYGTGYGG